MSSQRTSEKLATGGSAQTVVSSSTPANMKSGGYSSEFLQQLIDQAAAFNVYAVPDLKQTNAAIHGMGDRGNVTGIRVIEDIHRFEIALQPPSSDAGVRAANTLGELTGKLDLRWMMIPYEFVARPDREPPPTLLDPSHSQRFIMQETTFTFGGGRDGFRSFGTGRTFPMMSGGRPKLVAAAVGNITEGFGKFTGHEGNFTLCGELIPNQGFLGHIVVRVVDYDGSLRTKQELLPVEPRPDPDPESTYITFTGQKGEGPGQENSFSLDPDGQVRGLNIPTELKRLCIDFSSQGPGGIACRELRTGETVGREIGFGRGSIPGASQVGTALSPFQFEGVAHYTFVDKKGTTVGAITTNVLEGRRFDMTFPTAPGQAGLRFGFFGPIVRGSGCFQGVEGMFYGASGSIFNLPPGAHVVTHLYMACINDPSGRFRAAIKGAGC